MLNYNTLLLSINEYIYVQFWNKFKNFCFILVIQKYLLKRQEHFWMVRRAFKGYPFWLSSSQGQGFFLSCPHSSSASIVQCSTLSWAKHCASLQEFLLLASILGYEDRLSFYGLLHRMCSETPPCGYWEDNNHPRREGKCGFLVPPVSIPRELQPLFLWSAKMNVLFSRSSIIFYQSQHSLNRKTIGQKLKNKFMSSFGKK